MVRAIGKSSYTIEEGRGRDESVIDIDIVIVFDIFEFLDLTPGKFDKEVSRRVFQYFDAQPDPATFADQFCPSLAELDFMGEKLNTFPNSNDNLKKLILLAKFWAKTVVKCDPKVEIEFKSYLVELLCLHLWETKLKEAPYDLLKWFYELLKMIEAYRLIDCLWTDKYDAGMVPFSIKNGERPRVVDPENPWRNVAEGADWERVGKIAVTTMRLMGTKYGGRTVGR